MSLPENLPKEATNYLAAIFAAMQDGCECKACKILQQSANGMIQSAMSGASKVKKK